MGGLRRFPNAEPVCLSSRENSPLVKIPISRLRRRLPLVSISLNTARDTNTPVPSISSIPCKFGVLGWMLGALGCTLGALGCTLSSSCNCVTEHYAIIQGFTVLHRNLGPAEHVTVVKPIFWVQLSLSLCQTWKKWTKSVLELWSGACTCILTVLSIVEPTLKSKLVGFGIDQQISNTSFFHYHCYYLRRNVGLACYLMIVEIILNWINLNYIPWGIQICS